jgi:hypothetical protein
MEMIDGDPSHRSIEYLMAVVDKELAVRRAQMLENKELMERSKVILDAVVTAATFHDRPIDWDSMDKIVDIDILNKAEFDKVK